MDGKDSWNRIIDFMQMGSNYSVIDMAEKCTPFRVLTMALGRLRENIYKNCWRPVERKVTFHLLSSLRQRSDLNSLF